MSDEIELSCEDCGADFNIDHEMGFDYIPHFCVFCGVEIYIDEEDVELEIANLEEEW